jgi:hypothetical protein
VFITLNIDYYKPCLSAVKFPVHGEFQGFTKARILMNNLFQRWNLLKDGLKSAGHEVFRFSHSAVIGNR